jgi:short subunit dehydrogenase-like uncharacterized protein
MAIRRIVVVGAHGFFGAALLRRLRADGAEPLVAARRGPADICVDVEDLSSIRAALHQDDVVVDAAGPFHARTPCLAHAAMEIGFDLLDLADSLEYVRGILALRDRIERSGIRVLTACSSVSTVSATLVKLSGVEPVRVAVLLAPATRYTASSGTAAALAHSLGRPVQVFRHGRLTGVIGWREARTIQMPAPVGCVRMHLIETVDALTLPAIYPQVQRVDMWVSSRSRLLDLWFFVAARAASVRAAVVLTRAYGVRIARLVGATSGAFGVEIEDAHGTVLRHGFTASRESYVTAVAPAALVARAISENRFDGSGLVPHDRHVDPLELVEYLGRVGVTHVTW